MKILPSEVQSFLSVHCVATIATFSQHDDYPYALPVFYIIDENVGFYFASHRESKKIRNINFHPHIAISITDDHQLTTLLLQGTATIVSIKDQHHLDIIKKIVATANKQSENALPPIMKTGAGAMEIIHFTIRRYRLSCYSEKDALLFEGEVDETSS